MAALETTPVASSRAYQPTIVRRSLMISARFCVLPSARRLAWIPAESQGMKPRYNLPEPLTFCCGAERGITMDPGSITSIALEQGRP